MLIEIPITILLAPLHLGTIAKVHCSYVVQQMSWHSARHSSFDFARPSGPGVFSHLLLQSEILLRKLGSFLVPLTSLLSRGFWPGTIGLFPVFHMMSPFSAASAGSVFALVTVIPTPVTIAENARLVQSRRLLVALTICSGALFDIGNTVVELHSQTYA